MKRKMKRLCCALLSATTLASTFTFLPVNAVSVNQSTTEQAETNYESTEIPEGMGATGDLSLEKGLSEGTKIIKSVDDYYKELEENNLPISGNVKRKKNAVLPYSVDNSQSKYFPPVGNQGSVGSCTNFAQVYYQFTYTYNKTMGIESTAKNAFSPKFVYNYVNGSSDIGSTSEEVYDFMKTQGNVPLEILPYDENYLTLSPTEEVWASSIKYRIKDYQYFEEIGQENTQITSHDDSDLVPIKTALNNGEVLSFSTCAYSFNVEKIKTNPKISENEKYKDEEIITRLTGNDGVHRMALVGYNDNIWCDVNNNNSVDSGEMGAFKIVNSWGEKYANDGFIWVAYDAVNEFSSVSDMEQIKRERAIDYVGRIDIAPEELNDYLYIKFTLNSAFRYQTKIKVYAEKNGTISTCTGIPVNAYDGVGGELSYDGTTEAHDGTFVCPLDRVIPDISSENLEEYTFQVEFGDTKADGNPTIVKDAAIVDKHTNKTYTINNEYPFEVDGNSKTVDIHYSSLNNIVIYYIGYDNPTLHIKEERGEWQSIPMSFNIERRGATHKYVFEIDTFDRIWIYFTDGDNIDDNNGKYYTATNGLNFFRTKDVHAPLTAQYSTNCENVLDLNQWLKFDVVPEGGYAPYTYEIIHKNLETGEERVKEYGHDVNSPHQIFGTGKFIATINVKDYANDIYTMYYSYEVKNLPFEFKEFTVEPNGTSVTGRELNFKAVTKSENVKSWGSIKSVYDFVIKRGDEVCHSISKLNDEFNSLYRTSTNYLKWTPTQAGVYTITVSSEDGSKEYAEKSLTFEIKDDRIGDVNGDSNIDIADVTAIQMHLAKMSDEKAFRTMQSDCDKNSVVNIDDATYIQLHIAEYIWDSSVGEIIEYQQETTVQPTTQPTTEPTTQPITQPTTEPTTQPTTVPTKNTVTFTNSFNWGGTISCYYWSDSNTSMTKWPGVAMTYSETNDFGEKMYTFDVPQGATYIIFTNGIAQTTDIPYNGGEVRYYPISSTDSKGHNLVNTW